MPYWRLLAAGDPALAHRRFLRPKDSRPYFLDATPEPPFEDLEVKRLEPTPRDGTRTVTRFGFNLFTPVNTRYDLRSGRPEPTSVGNGWQNPAGARATPSNPAPQPRRNPRPPIRDAASDGGVAATRRHTDDPYSTMDVASCWR